MVALLVCCGAVSKSHGQGNVVLDPYSCADFLKDAKEPSDGSTLLRSLMMIAWGAGYAAAYQKGSPRADPQAVQLIAATLGQACRGTPERQVVQVLAETITRFAASEASPGQQDAARITEPAVLQEVRDRLYELNYGSDNLDDASLAQAIRDFEGANQLAVTGAPTHGVLRKLRDAGSVKPWGSIVYSRASRKWGISWNQGTRKEAVTTARASCGDGKSCVAEVSFFGNECGAFAHSGSAWSMAARKSAQSARDAALSECRGRGSTCAVVAAVCADGSDRYPSQSN